MYMYTYISIAVSVPTFILVSISISIHPPKHIDMKKHQVLVSVIIKFDTDM